MFWVLIPIAVAAGLAYNAFKDDSSSKSSLSDHRHHLAAQKGKRTKYRKKLFFNVIENHLKSNFIQIEIALNKEKPSIGLFMFEKTTNSSVVIYYTGIEKAIDCLSTAFGGNKLNNKSSLTFFETGALSHKSLLKKADEKYGSYAGLDNNDNYDPSTDQFVLHLKSIQINRLCNLLKSIQSRILQGLSTKTSISNNNK